MSLVVLLTAIAIAAGVAYVGAGVAAHAGPRHAANERSNHTEPTPVGAGLGVVAGVMAGLLLVAMVRPDSPNFAALVGLALMTPIGFAVAVIGFLDDVYDWSPRLKFALLSAAAVGVAYAAGPVAALPVWPDVGLQFPIWFALAGSTLWVFTMMNAVNFMDGADGMAGGAVGVASGALAVASCVVGAHEAALAAGLLCGALCGFLPWNAPVARVFMGDVGSLFIGLWFAGAGLLFVAAAPVGAVYLPPLLLLPILADTLLTLAWRAKHRRALLDGHRDHAYQLRIQRGQTHANVARDTALRALGLGVVAVAGTVALVLTRQPAIPLGLFVASIVVMTWLWVRDRAA